MLILKINTTLMTLQKKDTRQIPDKKENIPPIFATSIKVEEALFKNNLTFCAKKDNEKVSLEAIPEGIKNEIFSRHPSTTTIFLRYCAVPFFENFLYEPDEKLFCESSGY